MLEDLAIQYASQSEDTLGLIGLGLAVVGAVIAGLVRQSKAELARAPYFVYSALIVFVVSAGGIVWLQAIPAMTGGYLWLLMTISLAASIAGGYCLYRIAMARSRDAYGHSRMAFLAFIPIANFWLLLTRSKHEMSAHRAPTIALLSGGLGVLSGFLLLAATVGVSVYIEEQARMLEQQAQTDPVSQQAAIESMIRLHGLEETLHLMAAESQTPITVDEVTTLARIEAAGTQLRRMYVVDLEGWSMPEEFRRRSRDSICASAPFEPILRAHGSIREVYVERSGRQIGSVIVTHDECMF